MTLAEFLLARISEDEAVAHFAAGAPRPRGGWGFAGEMVGDRWETRGGGMLYVVGEENGADAGLWDDEGCDYMAPAPAVGAHIARHDPTRVLAECGAKRRIVAVHRYSQDGGHCCAEPDDPFGEKMYWHDPCPTLAALATIYADHEDYREEWRP